MKKLLLAVLLAGVASSALAADLPYRQGAPAPGYSPLPFSWSGFYAGVNGGYGWGGVSNSNFGNPSGGLIGGQVGYNYQIGNFVGGLEADFDATDLSASNSFYLGSNKLSTGFMTTVRARTGYALDHALLFVTGGYAGVETTGSFYDHLNNYGYTQSSWRNGGVIGAGIEYAFTNNISAKAEYLYAPFAGQSYFSGPDWEHSGLGISMIRAGLNYHF